MRYFVSGHPNEVNLTECINNTDLEKVIMEVNSMDVEDKVSVTRAILGSLQTTPRPIQLSTFLKMYGNGGWDTDNHSFNKDVIRLEKEQIRVYSSKIDVENKINKLHINITSENP